MFIKLGRVAHSRIIGTRFDWGIDPAKIAEEKIKRVGNRKEPYVSLLLTLVGEDKLLLTTTHKSVRKKGNVERCNRNEGSQDNKSLCHFVSKHFIYLAEQSNFQQKPELMMTTLQTWGTEDHQGSESHYFDRKEGLENGYTSLKAIINTRVTSAVGMWRPHLPLSAINGAATLTLYTLQWGTRRINPHRGSVPLPLQAGSSSSWFSWLG